eukprot:TRINITY_DN8895_c0_g1_i1.p1 TRINITY_DN8895_c0_g1~~TRINITY_DN8895_c0_g1_i1.p1  ORF type:complete len:368 (+),score=77.66 TRINITY_DN8895_c0_g1_i1:196-1299(+)
MVLVVGGCDDREDSSNLNTCMLCLDTHSEEWTEVSVANPLAHPRKSAASGMIEGVWYVAGGAGQHGNRFDSVEAFDPEVCEWREMTSTPILTAGSGAAMASWGDTLVVSGGFDGQNVFDTVQIISNPAQPGSEGWTAGPPLGSPRFAHCSVAIEGKVWAIGGTNGADCLKTVEVLDLYNRGQSWRPGPSMIQKRFGASAAVLGRYLYIMGGFDGSTSSQGSQEMLHSVERIDLSVPFEHRLWEEAPSLKVGRASSCVAVVNNQAIYLIGGYDGTTRLSSVEKLRVDSDAWESCRDMPVCLGSAVACMTDGLHTPAGAMAQSIDATTPAAPAAVAAAEQADSSQTQLHEHPNPNPKSLHEAQSFFRRH